MANRSNNNQGGRNQGSQGSSQSMSGRGSQSGSQSTSGRTQSDQGSQGSQGNICPPGQSDRRSAMSNDDEEE
jgi:hypothetical protein